MVVIAGAMVLLAVALIVVTLIDAFQTVVLPRRVSGRMRLTVLAFQVTWVPWSAFARRMRDTGRREALLSIYGPLTLLVLLGLWATLLIFSFALLQWAFGSQFQAPEGVASFGTDLYMSGTTFVTLGLGDVTPLSPIARLLTVLEAGAGFGLLALVIGYLPALYQSQSQREVNISKLDARAGSPPSATELLRRYGRDEHFGLLNTILSEWEQWAAQLMESQLSYPVLCFFRSQHDNQSWVATLTTILDTCALLLSGVVACNTISLEIARLTFAMARHASVDLSQALGTAPSPPAKDRVSPADFEKLCATLAAEGVRISGEAQACERLAGIRATYEPYANAISQRLLMPLPLWLRDERTVDDWETSAWDRRL